MPVFDTVAQAVEHHGGPIDGSVVTVPPAFTKDAVFEAIENGIKLIVIVTERIPRRDVAQMVELATLRGARIIGPNCLGIIVPDVIKMGGIGGPAKDAAKAYTPGPIGVISRSGGMTTEMSSTLTAAGLGQSTAVSIGGDAIIGSSYAELMPLFEADEQTEGIVIYTEPGGRMEAELASWVDRERLEAADRRVHGGPLHGRDARHELRPRRHDRRGQGGHRRREDRAPRAGRHHRGGGDLRDPRDHEVQARGEEPGECVTTRSSSASRSTTPSPATPRWRRSSKRSARVDSSPPPTGGVEIVDENIDECILCALCVNAAPQGTVKVHKLYSDELLDAPA